MIQSCETEQNHLKLLHPKFKTFFTIQLVKSVSEGICETPLQTTTLCFT